MIRLLQKLLLSTLYTSNFRNSMCFNRSHLLSNQYRGLRWYHSCQYLFRFIPFLPFQSYVLRYNPPVTTEITSVKVIYVLFSVIKLTSLPSNSLQFSNCIFQSSTLFGYKYRSLSSVCPFQLCIYLLFFDLVYI